MHQLNQLKILIFNEKKILIGTPTLEKCKKLKKKVDLQKDVEALDTTNIIGIRSKVRIHNFCIKF